MQNKILVSITGRTEEEWQDKLKEINDLKIKEVALFLEMYEKPEREKIYAAISKSRITSIPLVHIRHDMKKEELEFLSRSQSDRGSSYADKSASGQKNFKTKYFTVHEENFVNHDVEQWKGFYKDIYLEMNFDNIVSKTVQVEKIGGFCVDLAHFKVGLEKLSKDFEYVFKRKDTHTYFKCNHLNGWNPKKNIDMHTIHNLNNFDYLKTLPKFVFGKVIALETFNSIKEQLEFKEYLLNLFEGKF